jgi:hypothetical protein
MNHIVTLLVILTSLVISALAVFPGRLVHHSLAISFVTFCSAFLMSAYAHIDSQMLSIQNRQQNMQKALLRRRASIYVP